MDAGGRIAACLEAIKGAGIIIVVDGGSRDDTTTIAARHGAVVLSAPQGRGTQLIAGAARVGEGWLLFLHADTVLDAGWLEAVTSFAADPANARRAAAFEFALDESSLPARRLERMVRWRSRALGLPYGDQGLLIHRAFYDALGGYRPLPIMEDVDLVRRIGRRRIAILDTRAVTSADRWRRDGWINRTARNLGCLALYRLGVPLRIILRVYG